MTEAHETVIGEEAWRRSAIDLLDRQIDLYQSLNALSEDQSRMIEHEDADALLRVLTEREGIIQRIGVLSKELAPIRSQWDRMTAALTEAQREELNERVRTATELLDAIASRDERDRREMERRRSDLASQLKSAGNARNAVAAYGRSPVPAGHARFQDRQG